jgi:hypothetical protein
LLARAKQIGLAPGDRAFWSWLEADEQLPHLEKALWEQMDIWEVKRSGPPPPRVYFQLRVDSSPLRVAEQTVLGDPFFGGLLDQCKCENGEIRGKLCSQLSIEASSWDGLRRLPDRPVLRWKTRTISPLASPRDFKKAVRRNAGNENEIIPI